MTKMPDASRYTLGAEWSAEDDEQAATGASLHPLLDELHVAGQDLDFREKLWHRLQDEALLDRDDLAESLDQMAANDVVTAVLLDEDA